MKRYQFHLGVSPERYLAYYQGTVRYVQVEGPGGETLRFPASLLTPFVTPTGIHGDFVLTCGDDFRGARLQRLG
jgi:hypothetical protein